MNYFIYALGGLQILNAALSTLVYAAQGETFWATAWAVVLTLAIEVVVWGVRLINEDERPS